MMIPVANDIKTVTDLRENTLALLNGIQKRSRPTIIMHHNSPKAVMLSIKKYNQLVEAVEDYMDELTAMDLKKEPYNSKNYVDEKTALKELGIKP